MSNIKLFQDKKIRTTFNEADQKWYFAITDVVQVLTESSNARRYWSDLKRKLVKEGYNELYENIVQLKLEAPDGKLRETDCADTAGLLRIIQSITSPKAEPFKRWLAKVGYERLQEIEDPELASKRARELYKAKGHPDDWVEKRMRSIAIREELTDEWKDRGIKEHRDYAILTAEISKAAFGLTPFEYKKVKGLKRENLPSHMSDLELIFSMLGEASTTEIARNIDAQGFLENKTVAKKDVAIAGDARKALELESGQKIVTEKNYLPENKTKKINEKKK
jgi:DNA-damage-inducible protein D